MGCVLGCLACSAASCCVGTTCSLCGKVVACKKSSATRALYVLQFIVIAVIAYIFSNWAQDWLRKVPVLQECNASVCFGALAVYRITFGLSALHLLLGVFMIGVKNSSDFRAQFQDGWWPVKEIILVALIVLSFFIPNSFFIVYGWIMVVGASIFILIQLVLLVEFAYQWNEAWVLKMENEEDEGGKSWYYLLLGCTLFMICLSIALVGFMYHFFGRSGCDMNTAFITITFIVSLALCAFSVHPKVREGRPSSGLLQSSVVMLFASYLVYSAIMSEPESNCNPFGWGQKSKLFAIILGAIFTIVSVVYSTIRTASSSNDLLGDAAEVKEPLVTKTDDEEGGTPAQLEDDEESEVTYNYFHFHLSFALGGMYIGMLLTNWMTLTGDHHSVLVDTGYASFWFKIVSGWITLLLYAWTLLGPVLLPNREWD